MSTTTITEQLEAQRHKVDFDTYDITVQQLLSMVADSTIDVAPTYQREFRWDATRRSMLIESILLGVPVPSLFMASNKNGTWELVDGVQRLSTICMRVFRWVRLLLYRNTVFPVTRPASASRSRTHVKTASCVSTSISRRVRDSVE